jgi:hypothetical protein
MTNQGPTEAKLHAKRETVAKKAERRLIDQKDWPPVVLDRDGDRWVWSDAEGGYQLRTRSDDAPKGGAWPPAEVEAEYGPLSLPGFSFWTTEPVKSALPPTLHDCDHDTWHLDENGGTYTIEAGILDGARNPDRYRSLTPETLNKRYGPLRTPGQDSEAWEPTP